MNCSLRYCLCHCQPRIRNMELNESLEALSSCQAKCYKKWGYEYYHLSGMKTKHDMSHECDWTLFFIYNFSCKKICSQNIKKISAIIINWIPNFKKNDRNPFYTNTSIFRLCPILLYIIWSSDWSWSTIHMRQHCDGSLNADGSKAGLLEVAVGSASSSFGGWPYSFSWKYFGVGILIHINDKLTLAVESLSHPN